MSDLASILEIESEELRKFFEKASIEGKGTPQEVSDRREAAFADFLRRYSNPSAIITKGIILGADDSRSASIDCVVLSPSHPRFKHDRPERGLILAEGVDLAVEVKPDLAKVSELRRGLKQGESVKRVWRNRAGALDMKTMSHLESDFQHRIPFGIYAESCSPNYRSLVAAIVDYYEEERTPRALQFDFIVVNRSCLVVNVARLSYIQRGDFRGIIVLKAQDSVAAFLALLFQIPKSELAMGSSVLQYYMKWKWENGQHFTDLDERLSRLG